MNLLKLFRGKNYEIKKWGKNSANQFISNKDGKLIINRNRKWKGSNNYDFLLEVKNEIKDLFIIDFSKGVDISSIEFLPLDELTLEVGIDCRWPRSFPGSLKSISYGCSSKSPTPVSLERVEKIKIWGSCNWKTLPEFESPLLTSLSVDSSKLKSLFTQDIKSLTELQISGAKNLSLDGIKYCDNLEYLDLVDLRGFVDLQPLKWLSKLRRLSLDGTNLQVDSIDPVCALSELSWVYLGNTHVLDGCIRKLGSVPKLQTIGFNDRRSYDIKLEDFLIQFNCKKP